MKSLLNGIDQNLLREYGLIQTFDRTIALLSPLEVEMNFQPEPSHLIKLLTLLDNEDEATLKVIYTYLELRLGVGVEMLKKVA